MLFFYRLVARFFPSIGRLLKESYFTLNGWRFDDLKRHVVQNKITSSSFALESTLRLALSESDGIKRIAFISCTPPEDTGIATCSLHTWLGSNDPVDFFTPVTDLDYFFSLARRLAGPDKKGPRLLDVGGFLAMDGQARYSDIVIAVGNSDHHTYVHHLLKKLASIGSLDRVTLYIHDPCVLNLVERGTQLREREFFQMLESIYQLDLLPKDGSELSHDLLIEKGVYGVRYFYSAGITKFMVNSRAAAKMLRDDLQDADATVTTLFHPAFLPALPIEVRRPTGGANDFVIGTFGVPDKSKKTIEVVMAVKTLKKMGYNARLLIAGFHARKFADRNARLLNDIDYTLFDGPTDFQLIQCMKSCDIAVQLREKNLGESSGVIPQLLCLGKSVIVSRIGSFSEIGESVSSVDKDVEIPDLAARILELHSTPIDPSKIKQYVEEHTPQKFRHEFLSALLDGSPAHTDAQLTDAMSAA